MSALERGLAVALATQGDDTGPVTGEAPSALAPPTPGSRGVIALLEDNCTVCMLCARECPDWCIYIDGHPETIPGEDGARDRSRHVLDRFAIDYALCMYCGICVEVCPFDALFWSPEFSYAADDVVELTHERERLREWMTSVPAGARRSAPEPA